MPQEDTLYAILTDAAEDCTPLWDLVWDVGGVVVDDPEAQWEASIPEAQRLVLELLVRGLVGVCRGSGWPPTTRNEVEVTREEAAAILAAATNWHIPASGGKAYFCLCATEDGMALWRKGRSGFALTDLS